MRNSPTFKEKEDGESLAVHLHRNADALGVTVDQRRQLRHAAALAIRDDRDDRVEAGRIAYQVHMELRASAADVYLGGRQGEKVGPYNAAGAVLVKGRDGLWSGMVKGDITEGQAEAGLAYRLVFEAVASSQLGSQLGRVDEASIKASSSHGAVARGLFRAYAGVRLTTAEADVLAADPSQRALTMLRSVAGEGRSIRSMGGGNTRTVNVEALRLALDKVCQRLTPARWVANQEQNSS